MATLVDDPQRRIVPRWRRWQVTSRLGLLAPAKDQRQPVLCNPTALDKSEYGWKQNRTLGYAGDFIGAAVATGHIGRALAAAKFVVGQSDVPRGLKALANRALTWGDSKGELSAPIARSKDDRQLKIRELRGYLGRYPRDALAWMDLAREYTTLGQHRSAKRPVDIALRLAPNSCLVVRTASRFYLKLGDPEQAHQLIRSCARVKVDPWLMAAEIAMAQVASKTSDLVKLGRRALRSGDFAPFHISELACALGTLEMETGTVRNVRRLFKIGLAEPTENAIAQAKWASRVFLLAFRDLKLEPTSWPAQRQYEASAWTELSSGNWVNAVNDARFWLQDEPFSSRPAVFGSWVTQVTTGDFSTAKEFADAGLAANPRHSVLLNNLAVALANLDRVVEARKAFEEINKAEAVSRSEATYLATQGLICYRENKYDEGRSLYDEAVRKSKNPTERVWALLHFAREKYRLDPRSAEPILQEGLKALDALPGHDRSIAERIAIKMPSPVSIGEARQS